MPEVFEVEDVVSAVDRLERLFTPVGASTVRRLLEEKGLVTRCDPASLGDKVYAVDSAFPKSPVNLVGGSVSIVAVAAVRRGDAWRLVRRWVIVEPFGDIDMDYVRGFARLQERLAALSLEEPEAIIFDGELVPRPGRGDLWRQVETASERVLELTSRGVIVAGVLKRSYSRTFAKLLELDVSDRVIASAALKRGEVMVTRHPDERLGRRGCVEAFYKPLRGPPVAAKLEACCPGGLGECCRLASFLAAEAGATGFPWFLDLADALVKREAAQVEAVAAALLSRLARRGSLHLGYRANLQEQGAGDRRQRRR